MTKRPIKKFLFVGWVISFTLIFCSGFLTWEFFDQKDKTNKGKLHLSKIDPFHPACMPCEEVFYLRHGENRKNFREYPLHLQSGYYKIDLFGPKGTKISFFGAENFQTSMGFLKLIKRDEERVTIYNLQNLKPETWLEVPSKKGLTGSYAVYFKPYPGFHQNIASISWNLGNSDK